MSYIIPNRLESLSNELLLDIFEYLDAYKLCQAFYELNHRINALLRSAHLHVLVNSSTQDKIVWNTFRSFINSSQIHKLSYKDDTIDEELLQSGKENLRFVYLYYMTQTSINKILEHIPTNNQLKCFYANEEWCYNNPDDRPFFDFLLIDHVHRFTSLVNLSLSTSRSQNDIPTISVIFTQLRRLSIRNNSWTRMLSRFLQDNTPNLRSLHFRGYWFDSNQSSEFVFKQIHELHINCSGQFIVVENILPMFPCLRRLHIDWENSSWCHVGNGKEWQEVIEKYLLHLKQLTMEFNEGIDEDRLKTYFISEFWLAKRVKVKMTIDKIQSRYRLVKTIYFGKQWKFDYFPDL